MKKTILFLITILLISCANDSDKKIIETQKKHIVLLEKRLKELEPSGTKSSEVKSKPIINTTDNLTVKQFSNQEIIGMVKEHLEFKTPHGQRKEFTVRKIDDNKYYVRYDYKNNDYLEYKTWETSIMEIEFFKGNKYTLSYVKGNEHEY